MPPPAWKTKCWAQIFDKPGGVCSDFFKYHNVSFISLSQGEPVVASLGSIEMRQEKGQCIIRAYTGDLPLSDANVHVKEWRDGWGDKYWNRQATVTIPDGKTKRQFQYSVDVGGFNAAYGAMVDGRIQAGTVRASGYASLPDVAKGCSDVVAPLSPDTYTLPEEAPLFEWRPRGFVASVKNYRTYNDDPHGTLRSLVSSTSNPGCYIACYTASKEKPHNLSYTTSEGALVLGQVRVSGNYLGSNCAPSGIWFESDLSSSQALKNICTKFFPECSETQDCWPGGDTGGWFGLTAGHSFGMEAVL